MSTRRGFLAGSLAALTACAADPRRTPATDDTADTADTALDWASPDPRPHKAIRGVVVLGVDGLNLELLRSLKGPGLTALAERSVDCTRVFADYPLCAPTRASTLTALPPHEHGQIGNAFVLSDDVPTVVDHLAAHGVTCALFGKQHSNSAEVDGAFGYATVVNRPGDIAAGAKADGEPYEHPDDVELLAEIARITQLPLGGTVRPRAHDPDWKLLGEGLDEVQRLATQDDPFFVNIQLLAPHHPYSCPEEFYTAFDPADMDVRDIDRLGFEDSATARREVEDHSWDQLRDEHVRLLLARLSGMHLWADELLRYTLFELDRRGLLDDVLFVFTSDHGEMAGNKGVFLKNVFEDHATRIALMMRWPGQLRGQVWDGLLSCRDVLPTLGGVLGVPSPEGVHGRDFSTAIRLGAPARRQVFAYCSMYRGQDDQPVVLGEMIRTERWKYCRFDERGYPAGDMDQLYDLEADPGESVNLAYDADKAWLIDGLAAAIDAEVASYGPLVVPLSKG